MVSRWAKNFLTPSFPGGLPCVGTRVVLLDCDEQRQGSAASLIYVGPKNRTLKRGRREMIVVHGLSCTVLLVAIPWFFSKLAVASGLEEMKLWMLVAAFAWVLLYVVAPSLIAGIWGVRVRLEYGAVDDRYDDVLAILAKEGGREAPHLPDAVLIGGHRYMIRM